MGSREIRNTSGVSFVVASESGRAGYDKTYATSVSCFAVNLEENSL